MQWIKQRLGSKSKHCFFILKPDGLTYFVSDPTSDAQLNGMKGYLERKGWYYMLCNS